MPTLPRKPACSEDRGGNVALPWRKSRHSSWGSSNCAEVAQLEGRIIGVRDSKNPEGHVLRFTEEEWDMFLDGVRQERTA